MGKKDQIDSPLQAENYWTSWPSEDPSIPSFNPSTEHNIPECTNWRQGPWAASPRTPTYTPSAYRPWGSIKAQTCELCWVYLSVHPSLLPLLDLKLEVAGCLPPSLLFPAAALTQALFPAAPYWSAWMGPVSSALSCPWRWCAVGLCQVCAGIALGFCSCRAVLPVLLPGGTKRGRTGVLRQKTWGVSIWNLFLCSFKTKCFPDLEFQGRGMFFQNNLLLWDGCQGLQKIQLLGMVKEQWMPEFQAFSFQMSCTCTGDLCWGRGEWQPF